MKDEITNSFRSIGQEEGKWMQETRGKLSCSTEPNSSPFQFHQNQITITCFSKNYWLLLKVTKVTTGHQKWPEIGQHSKIGSFFTQKAKKPLAEAIRRS